MKNIFGIALLVFGVQLGYGQQAPELITDVDVSVSEPFDYNFFPELSVINGDHYYAISRDEGGMEFLKFDVSGTPKLVETNVDLTFAEKFDIDAFKMFNDKWHVFYSVFDKEAELERLFLREVDLENLAFKGEAQVFIKTDGRLTGSPFLTMGIQSRYSSWGGFGIGVVDKFTFVESRDGSKHLVYYINDPEINRDAKSHLTFGYFVFDNDLNEIWHSEVEMPYTEKKMNFLDIALSNEGDVFMAVDVFDDDSKKYFKRGELNHHPEMLVVRAGSQSVEVHPIDPKGIALSNVSVFENHEGQLTYVGLFTEFDELEHARGYAVIDISKQGNVTDFAKLEFPIDVLGEYESSGVLKKLKKNKSKGKLEKVIWEFPKIQDVIYFDDGSLVINSEQIEGKDYYSPMRGSLQERLYYRDILACKITPNNEFDWIMKLGKSQGGGRGGKRSMGFEHIRTDEHRYYFFIDHYSNEKTSLDAEPRMYTENNMCIGRIAAYRIHDSTGKLEKISILDTRKVKLNPSDKDEVHIKQFNPGGIIKIGEDTFMFEAYKGAKENVFIKFKVRD